MGGGLRTGTASRHMAVHAWGGRENPGPTGGAEAGAGSRRPEEEQAGHWAMVLQPNQRCSAPTGAGPRAADGARGRFPRTGWVITGKGFRGQTQGLEFYEVSR